MNDNLKLFTDNQKEFLKFLKSRYTLIHSSNIFFRDIHYGIMAYLELNRLAYKYLESEQLARNVIASYEASNIFQKVDGKTWVLNYPEFKLAPAKPAAAAKPAASAARPAGAPAPKPAAPSVPLTQTEPAARETPNN